MNDNPRSLLGRDIFQHILAIDAHNDLTVGKARELALILSNFVYDATLKYIAGQREHGGELKDRDCLSEARKEVIDIFWYLETEKTKHGTDSAK